MIDKDLLQHTVETSIEGTDLFLVDITVSSDNDINVEVDSPTAVDIDECAEITRNIEAVFDRDEEDYSLTVGSAGITSPLKIRAQFVKYLNKDLEVLTRDGRKLHGVLVEVGPGNPGDRDIDFTVEVLTKVKEEGQKKPVLRSLPVKLTSGECKHVRYDLKF